MVVFNESPLKFKIYKYVKLILGHVVKLGIINLYTVTMD